MTSDNQTMLSIDDIATEWVEMDDGCQIAMRIWRPTNAHEVPVPAIMEMIPYRRRDGTAAADATRHPYIAGHGYACVRVDIRGTGDSGGIVTDEYTDREHADACAIIAWLAEQPWCNGNIGMWGISWGGFNSLQIAALNPPNLKAIITLCASDDRYADDAHYLGGCLVEANLRWGTRFLSETARPPDPRVVGDKWRDIWLERLNRLELFPNVWLQHQTRDDYWKHGSACEAFDNITAAVLVVGGWSDAYVNSVGTTLAGVRAPKRGLIGPWGHDYPHVARPAPSIGFLQEAIRWWDHWLKGRDTGIMDEPVIRTFVMDSQLPRATRPTVTGRWTFNDSWPPENVTPIKFSLGDGTLDRGQAKDVTLHHKSPLTTGTEGGEWNTWGTGAEFGGDQRKDDGQSLGFESQPLAQDIELFGAASVKLSFSVDQQVAMIALRLSDVWPEGETNRITYGLMNLNHIEGHETPKSLVPGKIYEVTVNLRDIAYVIPVGHRIRLAISTNYWPLAWPSPKPVALTVHTGGCELSLPDRESMSGVNVHPQFGEPVGSILIQHQILTDRDSTRQITRDLATEKTLYVVNRNAGSVHLTDTDVTYTSSGRASFEICGDDPLSMVHVEQQTQILESCDWHTRVEARTELTATIGDFVLRGSVEAFENGDRVFAKDWETRNKRIFI